MIEQSDCQVPFIENKTSSDGDESGNSKFPKVITKVAVGFLVVVLLASSFKNKSSTADEKAPQRSPDFKLAKTINVESKNYAVGDEVCITGYVVDNFCIDAGGFLDNPSVNPLEFPEQHSFHCMLDVPQCIESGYQVLGELPQGDMHCMGFRLDDTDAVVAAASAAGQKGQCTACTGDETKPTNGYLATVKGTVSDLGDGSSAYTGTPILTDIQLLDPSVECETAAIPPMCMSSAPSPTPPTPGPPSPTPPPSSGKDCTKLSLSAIFIGAFMIVSLFY